MVTLLSSVIIGFIIGCCLRYIHMSPRQKYYVGFPGEILMNMLKMIILPLIVSSLVSSMASLDGQFAGRIGLRTFIYYMCTSVIASIIGIILVLTIRPGSRDREEISSAGEDSINPLDALLDMIRWAKFAKLYMILAFVTQHIPHLHLLVYFNFKSEWYALSKEWLLKLRDRGSPWTRVYER